MSPPLPYEKNAYIRELQRALVSKDVGRIRLEEKLRNHPERMECLFDRRVSWVGADDMELRLAWHVLLRTRPELVGAFIAKLEERHPVWWQVITPETLFEPGMAERVMEGMALWKPDNARKAIHVLMRQMIRMFVMRLLAVKNASDGQIGHPQEWIGVALDHLSALGQDTKMAASEAVIMTVYCCARGEEDLALSILDVLLPVGVDQLNAKSKESREHDCVILALRKKLDGVARRLVEGGADWQQAMGDPGVGALAQRVLSQCSRLRRYKLVQKITPSLARQTESSRRNKL